MTQKQQQHKTCSNNNLTEYINIYTLDRNDSLCQVTKGKYSVITISDISSQLHSTVYSKCTYLLMLCASNMHLIRCLTGTTYIAHLQKNINPPIAVSVRVFFANNGI